MGAGQMRIGPATCTSVRVRIHAPNNGWISITKDGEESLWSMNIKTRYCQADDTVTWLSKLVPCTTCVKQYQCSGPHGRQHNQSMSPFPNAFVL